MSLTPEQAGQSLQEIERAGRRSAEAHLYASASSSFLMWGLIWMIGYGATGVLVMGPYASQANWLWGVLVLLGWIGAFVLGWRQNRNDPGQALLGARRAITFLVLAFFTAATIVVMRPSNPMAVGAFVPLIVATAYVLFGIWRGIRFFYAGALLMALTLGGFIWLQSYFLFWMAVVGGGALVIAGLWLRKV